MPPQMNPKPDDSEYSTLTPCIESCPEELGMIMTTVSQGSEQEEAVDDEPSVEKSSFYTYVKSPDFRELLVCLVFRVMTNIIFLFDGSPRERPIPVQYLESSGEYVRNLVFNEEFKSSSISPFWHSLLSYFVPPLLQMGLAILGGKAIGHKHAIACVYIVAFGLTNLATEALKLYVGYQRPFFFDHCQPDENYQACTDEEAATSARKSFPSGHASMSFCGLLLLTLYIEQFWGVSSVRKDKKKQSIYRARAISMLSLLPLALAALFASSRIVDNKHFPADVVAGSVLGAGLAYFTHSLWF